MKDRVILDSHFLVALKRLRELYNDDDHLSTIMVLSHIDQIIYNHMIQKPKEVNNE